MQTNHVDPDSWHQFDVYEAAWSAVMDMSPSKPTPEQDKAERERQRDEASPDPRSPRQRMIALLDHPLDQPLEDVPKVTQTQDEMLAALGYGSTEQLKAMLRAQGVELDEPEG